MGVGAWEWVFGGEVMVGWGGVGWESRGWILYLTDDGLCYGFDVRDRDGRDGSEALKGNLRRRAFGPGVLRVLVHWRNSISDV